MEYHFRNLVFEGGGVKGIAYAGVLQVLEEKGILKSIRRVGGTSAGAINALLLGLGWSLLEIEDILKRLDFNSFLDSSWGFVRDIKRLLTQFGWYKGDAFRAWIASVIKEKTGSGESTFDDIVSQKESRGFRDLYFVGTNLSTGFGEVFSNERTPKMCVADAIRISMSIPLFFAAKRMTRGDVYVDGGLLDNYPIKLFDRMKYVDQYYRVPPYYGNHNDKLKNEGKEISPYVYNKETLGFRLDSAREIAVFRDNAEPVHEDITNVPGYIKALVGSIMDAQANQHLHSDDWQRTIYVDTIGVGTTDFDLTDEKKKALVASGKKCTGSYFTWYDDPRNAAVNRPESITFGGFPL
jgi:NTE family protein